MGAELQSQRQRSPPLVQKHTKRMENSVFTQRGWGLTAAGIGEQEQYHTQGLGDILNVIAGDAVAGTRLSVYTHK